MNKLLNALRVVAREQDATATACPDDQIPVVSEPVRADIAAQILGQLSRARGEASPGAPAVVGGAHSPDQLGARREEEVRRQARRRMGWSLGTAALAAAAAFVLWNRQPQAPAMDDGPHGLPDYAVAASGGVAATRGAGPGAAGDEGAAATTTAPPIRLSPSSELRVTCRPDTAVSGPVAVRAFVVRGGGATEVFPQVQLAPSGAVDLRLSGEQVRGAPSAGHPPAENRPLSRPLLRVVVGRPPVVRDLGSSEAVAPDPGRSRPGDGDDRRWLTVPLDLDDQQRLGSSE